MAGNTYNDGSSGDVVIRPGPSGSSGGDGGFFSIGGGGGFGGGFGGSSRRRAKKRAQARAAALAKAQAEEQARRAAVARAQAEAQAQAKAHRQRVDSYGQAREVRRTQLDQHFAAKGEALSQALEAEVLAARRRPEYDNSERWQLYQTTKARNETNGLIDNKRAELAQRKALAQRFGDPAMVADAYVARLASLATDTQMHQLHRDWEAAYASAQEALLLQQAIEQLSQRSASLALEHAQQREVWRLREAEWERQRQYAEQREARIRFKQQADEDRRLQRLKQAATLTAPVAAAHAGGVLLTSSGAQVAAGAATAIEQAVIGTLKEVARIAAIRAGQAVSLTATAMLYSPPLGDGELTAAQRQRHLEGLGVRADLLGITAGQDLQAIADAGGSASIEHRIKIEHLPGGTAIAVASTGAGVAAQVRVKNAVFDPLSGAYRVDADAITSKTVVLSNAAVAGEPAANGRLLMVAPQVSDVLAGADLRFDDCIVCIAGQPPQYFSFAVAPAGTGVVGGKGQTAGADWWSARTADSGLCVPAQVGDQLRGRTFSSLPVFGAAVWRAMAADEGLLGQLDEVNQRRLLNGFAPVAARSTWVGERRTFELRHVGDAGVGSGLYDLGRLRIHAPASRQGVLTVVEPFKPWFASGVELGFDAAIVEGQPPRTWTPLVPPGIELLGSTVLPEGPTLPGVYPGGATDPVVPDLEIYPGESPDETGATIPGSGGDVDLPSPGLVNYEPAKPLEVGEYKDLSRRSINDLMDVDHIVSRRAYQIFLSESEPRLSLREKKELLEKAPSIVIPAEVHRKFSETYGGRNSLAKQLQDASDLRSAVDSNLDALKPGLLEYGFSESQIEHARQQLHEFHVERGMYQ
ncbi:MULTISPECIES: S-type pyocin domain-containing protein [Pseudomonas]|uniref:S-type pyocin domain-containing protein n=1 Tax=Pseudomonas TaxID=286 RepID=UPI001E4E9F65|nr:MULTISPECIES: S-type pyocin domain-containing protein [Pseudomonas]MCE1116643.1 S-type pyocin domain-containing protein [Pseudomonas sp. NMI795_08]